MAITNDTSQAPAHLAIGSSEIERLQSIIRELQDDCNGLRQVLAKTEIERDQYRYLFINELRTTREFEDLDISTLEAMSAGPVEMIE